MDNLPDPYSLTETQLRSLYDSPGFRSLPVDYQDSVIRARYALGKRQRANLSSQYFAGKEAAQAADKEATQNLLKGFATPPVSPEEDREGRTGGILARTVFPYEGELFKDMYQGVPAPKETPAAAAPAAAVEPPAPSPLNKVGAVFGMPPATRFTPPTPPKAVDEEEARRRLAVGMPEARKAEDTYKADPYMTMLQTGLRILATQPQVGQNAISTIAAPISKGVEEFVSEKEKERLSKREEAKTAREEEYRRYGAQRDIEKTILDLAEKTKDRDQTYQNLRLMQEKGASEAEINRAKLALEAATYDLKKKELEGKVSPKDALETFQRLDKRRQELESLPSLTPVQQAELEGVTRLQAATQRAFGAYMGVEGRSAVAGEAREVAILRDLEKQISDLTKIPVATDESRKRLAELRQMKAEISARLGLGSSTWQNPNVVGVTSKQ